MHYAPGREACPLPYTPFKSCTVPRPIFISYAREDATAADRLVAGLEERGFTPWIDREGILSGSWKERVTEGLNHARAVVLLLLLSGCAAAPEGPQNTVQVPPERLASAGARASLQIQRRGELLRELGTTRYVRCVADALIQAIDRKSTRLNSSHQI